MDLRSRSLQKLRCPRDSLPLRARAPERSRLPPMAPPPARNLAPPSAPLRSRAAAVATRALGSASPSPSSSGGSGGSSSNHDCEDYVEVKVDSVRVAGDASVVFLRASQTGTKFPLHIGESESAALLKEITQQKWHRPLTHDLAKIMLLTLGARVTKIRITEMVNNIYYTRIHIAKDGSTDEVEVDSRPSDAINLAVRFEAPMYIRKRLLDPSRGMMGSGTYQADPTQLSRSESYAEIVRSVRETVANFEDPTTMARLQQVLAVREERYEDARRFQTQVFELMTHSAPLRLVLAMETALADGRFEEAAQARDEFRKLDLGTAQVEDSTSSGPCQ